MLQIAPKKRFSDFLKHFISLVVAGNKKTNKLIMQTY